MGNISKCLTQQQYLSWQQMAKRVRTRNGNDYCEDCLPEFPHEMIRKNKCQHPEVVFRVDGDGFEGNRGDRPPIVLRSIAGIREPIAQLIAHRFGAAISLEKSDFESGFAHLQRTNIGTLRLVSFHFMQV